MQKKPVIAFIRRTAQAVCLQAILLCCCSVYMSALAQNTPAAGTIAAKQTIKGKVVDEKGLPVTGVSVQEKGISTNGTTTFDDGSFTLNVRPNAVLTISRIGFAITEITAKDGMTVTVTAKDKKLEDLVVVGYGTQKKVNLTGAVTSVKMADVLGNRPVTDIAKALQGVAAGLQVTYGSGEPGASTQLNIRGFTSINGGSPLILVDNVPIDDISLLNPNDIESISVLKDAASASIYGGRTAYGVVLITTKRPIGDRKPQFEYSTNLTFSNAADLPKIATPIQILQMFKDVGVANFYGEGQDINKWMTYLNEYNKNPSIYPNGMVLDGGKHYWLKSTDKAKNLFTTGIAKTHNFAVSGGSEKTSYRISLGTTNDDGILVTNKDSYKRYSLSSFVSSDITKWMTAQLTVNYTSSVKTFPISAYPFGIFGNVAIDPSFSPIGYDTVNKRPYADSRNLVEQAATEDTKLSNIRPSGKIILKPLAGLTITGEYTFNKSNRNVTSFNKRVAFTDISSGGLGYSIGNSEYTKINSFTNYNSVNLFAGYEKHLKDHNFAVMGGFNQEESFTELVNSSMLNMFNEELPSLSQGTGTVKSKDYYTEFAVRGYFGRLNYSYKNKYLLEVNGRYDGSSKFPPNHKYGFFPSLSAGWRISEENFMQSLKPVLSDLKIRASWGEIGNQATAAMSAYPNFTNNYPYIPQMPSPNSTWLANDVALVTLGAPGLVSADFSWETVRTINFGTNVGLFNNKFQSSFDIYQRKTIGMLGPSAALPSTLGSGAPQKNAADLKTNGWEIEATWKDKIGKISYSIGFNLFDSKAKIVKYNNPTKLLSDADNKRWHEGLQIGEIWGYTTDRYYTVDDFVAGTLDAKNMNGTLKPGLPYLNGNRKANPGDVLYKDLDGNDTIRTQPNAITPGDQTIIGNNSHRFQFGINGSVAWNNFDLSFFIQGIGKRDLWIHDDKQQLIFPYNNQRFSNLFAHQLDYWTPNNPNAEFARFYDDGQYNTGYNRNTQTKYLSNGAYWRLKNVTIGYTVPAELLKRISITKFRVFVSGENMFTHKNMPAGVDPEETNKQYGMGYPFMKMYSFGVNLSF